MAKKVIFACGECHRILEEGIDECNAHPDAHCTGDWQGYVVILDPSRSEIAKKINVDSPGNYALKVNVR